MEVLHDIKKMICRELEDITRNGEMSPADLDVIDKGVDIVKDIVTIDAMGQEYPGYSGRPYYAYDGEDMGGSYGRGRYAKRDARGRYSNEYSMEYSRDTEEDIRKMMDRTHDDREREVLRNVLEKMKR